jgi:hypothetical protein
VRIPVCPAWELTCCLQSNDRRLWSQPKQNSKGVTARERPEEGECAALTAGTRTGSEAGSRAVSQLGLVKPNSTRRTRAVEPGGMKRRSMFLPGEIWTVRVVQKSAEAVVVMRLAERSEERRAEAWQEISSPGAYELGRVCRNRSGVATAAATLRADGSGGGWKLPKGLSAANESWIWRERMSEGDQ